MKIVFIAVGAAVMAVVTVVSYTLFYDEEKPDTSALRPYFLRMYEVETRCPKFDLFLQRLGVTDQKKRKDIMKTKKVFVLTGDSNGKLWWMAIEPTPLETWFIALGKKQTWLGHDNVKIESIFSLNHTTLMEIQTWKRKNGTTATLTVMRRFTDEYLEVTIALEDIVTEAKYKFKGMYNPGSASPGTPKKPQ